MALRHYIKSVNIKKLSRREDPAGGLFSQQLE